MFPIVKWAYRRGVMHERLRIKRLIAEFRNGTDDMNLRYQMSKEGDKEYREQRMFDMKVRNEATRMLMELVAPKETEWVPKAPAPIDADGKDE